ncbi:MAG: T9SS type A sorting domain-containing protein, partial [Prevotella sp.]|nr:T9SS type A sorting domain-containing protein [Prevotella sp.]
IDNASESDPAYGKTTNDVKSGLERKYWLLTKAAEGQNPRQVLVQLAPDGEWITSEGDAVDYQNPNYVAPGDGDPEPTEPATLQFYPHAVVAPGQGFFVQATGISDDLTVTFNRDMQAQSRFGMKDNEHGTPYTIVVGQAQVMEPLYIDVDQDGDGVYDSREQVFVDVDLNGNGIYGESNVTIEVDGQTVTRDEKEPAMVASYQKDATTGEFKTDEEGNKIPELTDIEEEVVIYKYVPETMKRTDNTTFDKEYPLLSRQTRGGHSSSQPGMVITAKRGADVSSALVMRREDASNDFLPSEDTESFINSDLKLVPTVYTLCGRLATTINSIQDFTCLPLGVESASDAPCTLTFEGVEQLGDSVAFYDAVEKKLVPLESGMKIVVSGQTQNRYYLVRSLIQEEAAAETHLQIFTEGLTVTVIASTEEPIDNVRCYDTAGRLVHTAKPQTREYSFTLPQAGVYIIDAQTENDRKTKKVMAK